MSSVVESKNVFKPDCVLFFNVHQALLQPGCVDINSKGESATSYSIVQSEDNMDIQLNHYVLQSKEYWTDVKMKRDYLNTNREMLIVHTLEEFIERDAQWNAVTDDKLYLKHKALYDSMDEVDELVGADEAR